MSTAKMAKPTKAELADDLAEALVKIDGLTAEVTDLMYSEHNAAHANMVRRERLDAICLGLSTIAPDLADDDWKALGREVTYTGTPRLQIRKRGVGIVCRVMWAHIPNKQTEYIVFWTGSNKIESLTEFYLLMA